MTRMARFACKCAQDGPSYRYNPISSKRTPSSHILFPSTAFRYKNLPTVSSLEMAHARPRVPKMATPHIRIAPPLGGAPRHSQELSQDTAGFLARPASFHLGCFDEELAGLSSGPHLYTTISPRTRQLKLSVFTLPNFQRQADPTPWLQLLAPYNSVEETEFSGMGDMCTGVAWALKQSIGETAQELLPALRILRIRDFDDRSICLTMSFVAARERTGRPVIIRHLPQRNDWKDMQWETFENDTCQD
ncbi:hypothetical protein BC827DRAFT_1158637 [Russula dissimulans]|nr:hypothetical protein BC827DRAFT_1158637 [Russula dissimulans]